MARTLAALLAALAWPAAARADLGRDVQTVSDVRARYGRVAHPRPRLLERGERLPLTVPAEMVDPQNASCTTVSILGVLGAHFALRFSRFDPGAPSPAYPEASQGGTIEVTRCGSAKPNLAGMVLEMRSPRGVLETVISNAASGVPKLFEILPERDPGSELSLGDPGPEPQLLPSRERLKRLRARESRDGAQSFQQETLKAAEDGSGVTPLSLAPGCHELTLLATTAAAVAPDVDVDVALVDAESGERVAVDRAEHADAMLSLCLGTPIQGELRFIGAPPSAPLDLLHATWELPPGLPLDWGPEPRARLALLARARHLRLLSGPVYSSLGVQGTTQLPLEVEPGACYSVLLVPLRGEPRSLSLSVQAQAPAEEVYGAADSEGTAVSFCVQGARRATAEVEGDGANLAWFLAVWASGRSAIGPRRP